MIKQAVYSGKLSLGYKHRENKLDEQLYILATYNEDGDGERILLTEDQMDMLISKINYIRLVAKECDGHQF